MNPQNKIRAADYEIRCLDHEPAKRFIVHHHYAKGCSRTSVYAHGLYRRGEKELLGVAMWLPPTKVAAQSVNRLDWRKVLSLSRLAVHPSVPGNAATFLMGRSIRLIRADRRFVSLVTYADDFMGHDGKIYLASNWIYEGFMKGAARWEDATGRQVAKLSTKSRTSQQMRDLGYRNVGTFGKHKFTMHLFPRAKAAKERAIAWFALAV